MKKLFLTFSLLFCLTAFSQEQYIYKGNGRVFDSKGQEVSPTQMRNLLSENTKALELYNAGRSKKTAGNLFLYGSVVPLTVFAIDFLRGNNGKLVGYDYLYAGYGTGGSSSYYSIPKYGEVSFIPLIIGGAMIAAAIPIKIGFSKKVKKAVDLMNEVPPTQTGFIESSSILINQNGVGIALKF